jgi:hypothetical protein
VVYDCSAEERFFFALISRSFPWVSNFNVTPITVLTLANQGGRLRWKIEIVTLVANRFQIRFDAS